MGLYIGWRRDISESALWNKAAGRDSPVWIRDLPDAAGVRRIGVSCKLLADGFDHKMDGEDFNGRAGHADRDAAGDAPECSALLDDITHL